SSPSARRRAWAARAAATSRRWRASPCSARRPSRACPRWRCGPSRTRSTSPTAGGGASRRPGCSSPPRCPRSSRSSPVPELPPPLPPEKRTVGQLVAEAIRFYGGRFWQVLPLGLPLAIADQLSVGHSIGIQMLVYWGTLPLFVAGYLRACNLVLGGTVNRVAAGVAVLVYLPFPALRAFFVLPGLAWLALMGLAVPVAMVERRSFRASLQRGRELGTADYGHALGSLATLVIVVALSSLVLGALLHTQVNNGQRVALFLSEVVLGALLFLDQAARAVGSARHADLHPPVDSDPAGRPDPQVES